MGGGWGGEGKKNGRWLGEGKKKNGRWLGEEGENIRLLS